MSGGGQPPDPGGGEKVTIQPSTARSGALPATSAWALGSNSPSNQVVRMQTFDEIHDFLLVSLQTDD